MTTNDTLYTCVNGCLEGHSEFTYQKLLLLLLLLLKIIVIISILSLCITDINTL